MPQAQAVWSSNPRLAK